MLKKGVFSIVFSNIVPQIQSESHSMKIQHTYFLFPIKSSNKIRTSIFLPSPPFLCNNKDL